MLKIRDDTGKLVATLKDEDDKPEIVEEDCLCKDCRKKKQEGEEDADTETTDVQ